MEPYKLEEFFETMTEIRKAVMDFYVAKEEDGNLLNQLSLNLSELIESMPGKIGQEHSIQKAAVGIKSTFDIELNARKHADKITSEIAYLLNRTFMCGVFLGSSYSEYDLFNSVRLSALHANKMRHQKTRKTKTKAADVARELWQNGSNFKHHQMKKYLMEEYQDENGKYPFVNLPDKALLDLCKSVAKEMDRPDLISGQKKSS